MPPTAAPIMIIDRDEEARSLASGALHQAGYVTREAADGEEALRAVRREPPSLVVVEVNLLPGLCGYEICRELREEFGERIPVLLISADRTESFDRVAGLLVGADDYLVKPFAPDELVARARALIRRSAARRSSVATTLTARELEVLGLLAEGLDHVEIATKLVISPSTVETHIEHILKKLGVRNRTQAVALAYREELVSISA
jgi:DNA-binding NarL/FixJ family response regulator